MVEDPEHDFLGAHRDKMWTYFILMALLIAIVIVINVVWKNPELASSGMKHFLGLPSWALALVMAALGALIFWGGLKVEPDWPEALEGIFDLGRDRLARADRGLEPLRYRWNRRDPLPHPTRSVPVVIDVRDPEQPLIQ